ncbi:MAG: DUF2752 domain-containing protein [bacterium]|nr:DUF2752 domain-containing protein [bacterium]
MPSLRNTDSIDHRTRIYQPPSRTPLKWWLRLTCLATGLIVLALLVLARRLEPSTSGLGTHQQLGLPPCTSIVLLNAPCPACGMTTSWAWFTRGQLAAAFSSNAGGSLLAIIALAYLPASCYFFFCGLVSRHEWFSLGLAIALITALCVATIQWWLRIP